MAWAEADSGGNDRKERQKQKQILRFAKDGKPLPVIASRACDSLELPTEEGGGGGESCSYAG
jgi:hypothetical protein